MTGEKELKKQLYDLYTDKDIVEDSIKDLEKKLDKLGIKY